MHSREEERSGEVERKQTDGDRGVKERERKSTGAPHSPNGREEEANAQPSQ